MTSVPRAAALLAKKLALDPGWTVRVVPGHGQAEYGSLSEERDGNGKRHRVSELVEVESVSVRARHADGRALWSVWVKKADEATYKFDAAMRGRDVTAERDVPRPLNSRQLNAYASAPDHSAAIAAANELGPKGD